MLGRVFVSGAFATLIAASVPAFAADPVPGWSDRPANGQISLTPPVDLAAPDDNRTVAKIDDIPASGSSTQYIHGADEGPVPGSVPYTLGGPPPNMQPSLGR